MRVVRAKDNVLYIVGESGAIGCKCDGALYSMREESYKYQELTTVMDENETDKLVKTIFKTIEGVLADG